MMVMMFIVTRPMYSRVPVPRSRRPRRPVKCVHLITSLRRDIGWVLMTSWVNWDSLLTAENQRFVCSLSVSLP